MPLLSLQKIDQNRTDSAGNALMIILILIILLAALTAVVMRSSNRASTNISTETARMQAEKLIRQAKGLETSVQRLTSVNRCSENEISFVNTTTTRDYTNAQAPTDHHCDLFHVDGAGMSYSNPDVSALDSSLSALSDYGQFVFTGGHCVLGLGSDDNSACTDSEVALLAVVPHVNLATCLQINQLMSITNPSGAPPEDSLDETAATFTGSYTAATDPELGEGASGSSLQKHTTGCLKNTSGAWTGSYIFYHMLITR